MLMQEPEEVRGRILRWGNSYALRLRKADMERLGFRPGDDVTALLSGDADRIDLSAWPVFHSGDPHGSRDHDAGAAAGYALDHEEMVRRSADPA